MNTTKEKAPQTESFTESIADNYPLHKGLEKLTPQEFMAWLGYVESEAK